MVRRCNPLTASRSSTLEFDLREEGYSMSTFRMALSSTQSNAGKKISGSDSPDRFISEGILPTIHDILSRRLPALVPLKKQ